MNYVYVCMCLEKHSATKKAEQKKMEKIEKRKKITNSAEQ